MIDFEEAVRAAEAYETDRSPLGHGGGADASLPVAQRLASIAASANLYASQTPPEPRDIVVDSDGSMPPVPLPPPQARRRGMRRRRVFVDSSSGTESADSLVDKLGGWPQDQDPGVYGGRPTRLRTKKARQARLLGLHKALRRRQAAEAMLQGAALDAADGADGSARGGAPADGGRSGEFGDEGSGGVHVSGAPASTGSEPGSESRAADGRSGNGSTPAGGTGGAAKPLALPPHQQAPVLTPDKAAPSLDSEAFAQAAAPGCGGRSLPDGDSDDYNPTEAVALVGDVTPAASSGSSDGGESAEAAPWADAGSDAQRPRLQLHEGDRQLRSAAASPAAAAPQGNADAGEDEGEEEEEAAEEYEEEEVCTASGGRSLVSTMGAGGADYATEASGDVSMEDAEM